MGTVALLYDRQKDGVEFNGVIQGEDLKMVHWKPKK